MKMQQAQQNLQSIKAQKQQIEIEKMEIERAVEELTKSPPENAVYKHAGSVLIKSDKDTLLKELEERKEMANTRTTVMAKQETRIQESLVEYETKLTNMMKNTGDTGISSP